MVGRPREHGEETRAALIACAERIVEAEGVDALSVRRIADEIGTTTRAVYSLFGSKEGLLVALGVLAFEILCDNIDGQRLSGDAACDLAIAGLAFRAFALEHPGLFRLAIQRDLPDPDLASEFSEAAGAAFGRLEARVDALREAGGLPARDVRQAATQYHALCEGLAAVELRGILVDRGDAEQVWRDGLAALVTGLQTKNTHANRRSKRS